jgi:hypothetical protein
MPFSYSSAFLPHDSFLLWRLIFSTFYEHCSNKTDMAIRLFTALRLEEQSLRLTIQEAATALATAYKVLVGYANFPQNGAVLLS